MQKSRDPRETAPHTKAHRQLRVMFTYYLLLSVMMSFVIRKKKQKKSLGFPWPQQSGHHQDAVGLSALFGMPPKRCAACAGNKSGNAKPTFGSSSMSELAGRCPRCVPTLRAPCCPLLDLKLLFFVRNAIIIENSYKMEHTLRIIRPLDRLDLRRIVNRRLQTIGDI